MLSIICNNLQIVDDCEIHDHQLFLMQWRNIHIWWKLENQFHYDLIFV